MKTFSFQNGNKGISNNIMEHNMFPSIVTDPQLLEGLKEESRIEDSWKREGVGARSLTRSTSGVEGRAGAPGLGLGGTSLIHLLEPASNQPQSG
jgi:hypothetical protein